MGQAGGISKPINSPKDCEYVYNGKNFDSSYNNRVLNLCWGTYYFPNGINVSGNNITINCGGGVTLVGPTHNLSAGPGIIISGQRNTINYCIVQSFSSTYKVLGNNNNLIGNRAEDGDFGFYILGSKNYIYNNLARSNYYMGFYIAATGNYLWNNLAEHTLYGDGFYVTGLNTTLYDNLAQSNEEASGFYINSPGSYNTRNENTAEYNYAGFDVWGTQNVLSYNYVYKNQGGILLYNLNNDLTGNNIDSNIVVGLHMHDSSDGTDLRDNLICTNPIDIKCENSGSTTFNGDKCNTVNQTSCGLTSCPATCPPASGCDPLVLIISILGSGLVVLVLD